MENKFYCGTSGLQITMPKRDFPPLHRELSRLAFYGLHENSVEINSTFYKLPQSKTVRRWASEVPPKFRFTFKLWKEVTHQKNLLFKAVDIEKFFSVVNTPEANKGCLLVQFPPSLQATSFSQLKELLIMLKLYDWPLAVEFRHFSWYKDEVFELLSSYNAAMVIQDMPKSASPIEFTANDLMYLRFHGPNGNYKGSYSDQLLYEYSLYIREWLDDGKTVYCYFNNTAGAALQNLLSLKDHVRNNP